MLLPFATLDQFAFFVLVLGRMGGLFAAIPLMGGKQTPMKIKAAAVFVTALLLYPVLNARSPELPHGSLFLIILVLRETLVGVCLGLLAQTIFSAVEFCGQLIGVQMGFSMVTQFDPAIGTRTNVVSVFQNLLAGLLFFSLGVHHVFIRAVVESYGLIPVGAWHMSRGLMEFFVTVTTGIFILAIKLAAPIMVSLLVAAIVLGIMSRAFPQMNVFTMSFPVNIGLGLVILGFTALVFVAVLEKSFGALPAQIKALFRLMA